METNPCKLGAVMSQFLTINIESETTLITASLNYSECIKEGPIPALIGHLIAVMRCDMHKGGAQRKDFTDAIFKLLAFSDEISFESFEMQQGTN